MRRTSHRNCSIWTLFVWLQLWHTNNIITCATSTTTTTTGNINKSHSSSSTCSIRDKKKQVVVIGVDGGTESIRACCFDAETGRPLGSSCAAPYHTYHPHPGWAEQNPQDWYECLGVAVRGAVASITTVHQDQKDNESTDDDVTENSIEFCGICLDTTCCSVVVLDENDQPLRPSLLWMDARSAPQTKQIMNMAKGDPALSINSNGEGPISAEWMIPKAMWIQQNEAETIWQQATTVCEYQDYLNFRLTGHWCASACNAAVRWHWNGRESIQDPHEEEDERTDSSNLKSKHYPGRPLSLYDKLGIPELAEKLPSKCIAMGSNVGGLTTEAARHLNLPEGLPVAQGGPDAFVGMLGLGCIHPGQLCLITGSSHLHCVVTSQQKTSKGVWGTYIGAPLPHLCFAEGGQSSTGSILRWAKGKLFSDMFSYKELDEEASKIPPGSDGLVALETFQGSRTPVTDPLARGAFVGLTLSHGRSHIWRALCESVCFGTKACVDALEKAGHQCDEIIMAGGATRSPLWLQLHADVTGRPVVLCENSDGAPLLGCAILASVNAGIYPTVDDAVAAMVRVKARVEPSRENELIYQNLYKKTYRPLAEAIRPIVHDIASIRGGDDSTSFQSKDCAKEAAIISPSLLAANWVDMANEMARCKEAGAVRLHVDIFDGVYIDSPASFTFGPKMVEDMRKIDQDICLDLHMCVDRPKRYIQPIKEAGGTTFIFMWEAMSGLEDAIDIARKIEEVGMACGVSINPSTPIEDIFPLLRTGLVSLVDVLAVEAGFGGQQFQKIAIEKVLILRSIRDAGASQYFDIMVDGGINEITAKLVPADIYVAGSYLFNHPESLRSGVQRLQAASQSAYQTR